MDYLYEDDEIICKINNFEMLSDKNIRRYQKIGGVFYILQNLERCLKY